MRTHTYAHIRTHGHTDTRGRKGHTTARQVLMFPSGGNWLMHTSRPVCMQVTWPCKYVEACMYVCMYVCMHAANLYVCR